MIQKIISGGQTGADRAGIDAAIESGVRYGGWLPKGRAAEDGPVPETYSDFHEMSSGSYPERTRQNVLDSDGTVIFGYGRLTTGSALTLKLARQYGKPYMHIDLEKAEDPVPGIQNWIKKHEIKVLNVAGRKASKAPGIYNVVRGIIKQVLM